MAAKIISQKRFAKGVSATTGVLSQPPGTLPRMSNLLMTQRGSLQICDGSELVATVDAVYDLIVALSAFSNLTPGQFPYYPALSINPTQQIGNVTGFTASPNAGAGNSSGTYFFGIVATISGGHSDISQSQANFNSVVTFGGATFNWTAVAGATGYSVYIYLPTGSSAAWPVVLLGSVGAVTTFTFSGAFPSTPSQLAPNGNTSYLMQLFTGAVPLAGALSFNAVTAGVFPSIVPLPVTLAPGSPGFSSSPVLPGYSPYGGLSGTCCNIPQIVQFAAKSILILGNGYAPHAYDPSQGSSASVTALANTFQNAFPAWQASVDWLTGDQVTDGSGNFYTATQGGVSGTTPPTWSTVKGTQTADGSVIWTSQGPIIASVAPRGAAHAVAYAGSLWLANTSPTTTSDQIDGPSCLKMSDANNPNSWNPVNTAFIGKDDGTQITGLQPFTIAALGISPTGSLCLFKEFTTYQIIGVFGSSTFEIQPAQTNLGCIAARSIQFIPGFGVVRFTHLGFAVFDGINDRLISEDIRPYLFGGVDSESDLTPVDPSYLYLSQSAQTIAPPMYFCAMPLTGASGAMTRLFCYDLIMKGWVILDLPWAITSMATISVGEGYPLVLAGKTDGTIQRLQSGDLNWDQGDSGQAKVAWSFRTPDLFGEGSTQRLFFENAVIRGYGNAAMVSSIVANLWLDGVQIGNQAIDIVPQGGSVFEARVRIFRNGERAHLDISGDSGGAAAVIDAIDWSINPKSSLARRVIG